MLVGEYLNFGFHTAVGGKNDGITADYFKPLDSAGLPIIIKSIGDFGIIKEVLDLGIVSGIKHVAAYRQPGHDVPDYNLEPEEAWSRHWFSLIQDLPPEYLTNNYYKENTLLHVINEVDKNRSDWIGWFCLAGAKHAVGAGYRFGFPSFSTGEPEPDHWETPGMLAFLDYAGHHKANVVIDLHEYSLEVDDIWAPRDPDDNTGWWRVGRFIEMLAVCEAHGIPYPLVTIGEFGWEENDIPDIDQAMLDIADVQEMYGIYRNVIGAFIWYLGPWHDSMDLANKTHKLIKPVAELALTYEVDDMTQPSVIKHTIHLLPQNTSSIELALVTQHLHSTRSAFTYSHDVVEATMYHSTPNGKIVVWEPERWDFDLEQRFAWLGVGYEEREFAELEAIEPAPDPNEFKYEIWPVLMTPDISQYWAENPLNYSGYCDDNGVCLPGHGGIDIPVPKGTAVYATHDGVAYRVYRLPGDHDFGNHVYVYNVEHDELTGYAHLEEIRDDLMLGDEIKAGNFLGWADNTGHSFGHHLHYLRKKLYETYVDDHGVWPYNLHDPSNLLQQLAPELFEEPVDPPQPPTGKLYDLVPYLITDVPRGVLYEVQTQYMVDGAWTSGPQQRHQTHMEDGAFYHTKGGDGPTNPSEWEQLMYDMSIIYRYVDTSMGNGRYYTLEDVLGEPWSAWCARYMGIGSTFARNPYVNVYTKDGCHPVSNGRDNTLIRLDAVYGSMTFFTNITLSNVIKLTWLRLDGTELESYYYSIGYGLVGWENPATRSAISEIHSPGSRPDNLREVIDCLD